MTDSQSTLRRSSAPDQIGGRVRAPLPRHNLALTAPIDQWDEAIPLGNGLMGALLWGEQRDLKLSLDRGDLWDLRPMEATLRDDWTYATMKRLVAEKDHARITQLFGEIYLKSPYPTKLPGGRLVLRLDAGQSVERFELDLRRAVGRAIAGRVEVEAFLSAVAPVGMIRVRGSGVKLRIILPDYAGAHDAPREGGPGARLALKRLGYPPAQKGRSGNCRWVRQRCAEGLAYAIVVATQTRGSTTEIAFAVTTTTDGTDPVDAGRHSTADALAAGFDAMLRRHVQWWRRFWSASAIHLPHRDIERYYYLTNYFLGSASRRGAPPMALQAVWTADDGLLPPWKGDYHHDLNTQMAYWSYHAAGHFDEGRALVDLLTDLLPTFRAFARRFYDAPGAAVPSVMSLAGQPLGGWPMYCLAPINSAWLAHAFYLHWRYTMDERFLAERAYPFCCEVGRMLEALLEPGRDGKLKLPLSSSPEIHDNRPEAHMTPNTNNDLALLRWLFAALAEMAGAMGDQHRKRWRSLLHQLDDFALEPHDSSNHFPGALKVSPDESLTESHRHHGHFMAVYPLGLIHMEGSKRDRRAVEQSLLQLDHLGAGQWIGFSFPWAACLAARARQGRRAENMLELFLKGFVSRNGFHLNGDYRNVGLARAKCRPFTIEAQFAAAQAMHEMLLQSWGGIIRLFPAVPPAWSDVRFDELRTEGAYRVSAERREGRTVWVRIVAQTDGLLRLADPFGGAKPAWSRNAVRRDGAMYTCAMRAGDVLEGRPQ